jgi:hypothetical protein
MPVTINKEVVGSGIGTEEDTVNSVESSIITTLGSPG